MLSQFAKRQNQSEKCFRNLRRGKINLKNVSHKYENGKINLKNEKYFCRKGKIKAKLMKKNGEPLIGASISLQGEKTGAAADENGFFTLYLQSLSATVAVSYLGYGSAEIIIYATAPLVISLAENTGFLNEVVVVDYGTQRLQKSASAVEILSIQAMSRFMSSTGLFSMPTLQITKQACRISKATSTRLHRSICLTSKASNSWKTCRQRLFTVYGAQTA